MEALDGRPHVFIEYVDEGTHTIGIDLASHLVKLDFRLLNVESKCVTLFADVGCLFLRLGRLRRSASLT